MREHTFRYVECSIPAGMTAREHLRMRQEQRALARRRGAFLRLTPLRLFSAR